MILLVQTFNYIEGFHNWKDAPDACAYLRDRHRHVFLIRCGFQVKDENREIEFNTMATRIEESLENDFGYPAGRGPIYGGRTPLQKYARRKETRQNVLLCAHRNF